MITTPISVSPIKKLTCSIADRMKTERDLLHLMVREPGSYKGYNRVPGKIQNHVERFREWRMPEQVGGYIKASKHNLL